NFSGGTHPNIAAAQGPPWDSSRADPHREQPRSPMTHSGGGQTLGGATGTASPAGRMTFSEATGASRTPGHWPQHWRGSAPSRATTLVPPGDHWTTAAGRRYDPTRDRGACAGGKRRAVLGGWQVAAVNARRAGVP